MLLTSLTYLLAGVFLEIEIGSCTKQMFGILWYEQRICLTSTVSIIVSPKIYYYEL